MSNQASLDLMVEERALQKLAWLYAHAMDRNKPEILDTVFTADGVIEGPGYKIEGRAQIRSVPNMLTDRYASTFHTVMNQIVTIAGDKAEGETYCLAYHILKKAEGVAPARYDMAIRYQDRYVRQDGQWRIAYRQLVVDWTKTGPIDPR